MAIPTIATLDPATGTPTGGQLVQLTGTGFQLTPPPPASGPVPEHPPTVEVLFNGAASTRVAVVSDTRLFAIVPKTGMPVVSGSTLGVLEVNVDVRNIDTNGDLIPGETATLALGYTYARPDISTANESGLTNLVRQLLQMLKSEVIPSVVFSVHTDYDSDPVTAVVDSATVPSIVIVGPSLTKNTFFTENTRPRVPLAGTEVATRRRPIHFDLGFDLIVIAHSDMELVNLIELITVVLDRNSAFKFTCPDPVGKVQLDLEWTDGLSVSKQSGQLRSNLRAARGSFSITGFPFVTIAGTEQDAIQSVAAELDGDVTLQPAEQIGDNLPTHQGAAVRFPSPSQN